MKRSVSTLLRLTQSFFQQHLQHTRGASSHTIHAYRDTLRLFFTFLAQQTHRGIDRLTLADVTVQGVLDFLVHLEDQRGNRPVTRNCRLAKDQYQTAKKNQKLFHVCVPPFPAIRPS